MVHDDWDNDIWARAKYLFCVCLKNYVGNVKQQIIITVIIIIVMWHIHGGIRSLIIPPHVKKGHAPELQSQNVW